MTTDDNQDFVGSETEATSAEEIRPGRRKLLIAGAVLVPTIVTLHATPAWAQTDYTQACYKYGDNAGMRRNPNAGEGEDEFIPCETGREHDESGGPEQGPGPDVF